MQEKTNLIIQAIIVICSVFTLVAAFVIMYLLYFNKRKSKLIAEKEILKEEFQNQLLQAQVEVQEITYFTVSKELHDNVGQLLSTSKMLLGVASRGMTDPPETLHTAENTIGEAIKELRSLSKSLDKEWLEQFSFTDNLKTEISRINAGTPIRLHLNDDIAVNLKAGEQIILFRIVQEALQNAIKHAMPDVIEVNVSGSDDHLEIHIYDNGKGFISNASDGMGLKNMKHRTHLLGGTITWQQVDPTGTRISLILPYKNRIA